MKDTPQFPANKKEFLEVLEKTLGNISSASAKVGIDRKTVYNWRKADLDFNEAVLEIQNEYAVDYVETKMVERINAGDSTMIMFFLNKHKHRGYGQQREREQTNNRVTTINIIHSDNDNEPNTEQ